MGKSSSPMKDVWDVLGTFNRNRNIDDSFDRGQRIYAPIIMMIASSLFGIIHFFRDPIEALSFQVPHLFWLKRASGSGLNLPAIMEGASRLTVVESKPDKRIKLINEIGNILNAYFRRNVEGLGPLKSWKKRTLYNMTLNYYVMKILYIACPLLQMMLLNSILDRKFIAHSISYMGQRLTRTPDSQGLFPLLAVCKFKNNIDPGKPEKEHLCSLPLNMYNGPVFAANFFILSFLMVTTAISIMLWTARLFIPSIRDDLLVSINYIIPDRFIEEYLRLDGILVLRLIRLNLGVHTSRVITIDLFERYKTCIRKKNDEDTSAYSSLPPQYLGISDEHNALQKGVGSMNLNTSTPENRSRANSLTSVNKKTGLHQYTEDKEAHLAAPDLQQRFASTGNLTVTSMQQPDQPMVHLSGLSNQLQPQSMSHLDGQLLHRRFPAAGRLNGHMSPVDQVKILHPEPGYAPPQRRGSNSSLVSSV